MMKEENRKEFDKYMNEQFNILEVHMNRIHLRVWNKYMELNQKELREV